MRRILLFALAFSTACALESTVVADVGLSEAGPNLDSGPIAPRPDTSVQADSGAGADAAVRQDSGPPPSDSGVSADGGAPADGGPGDSDGGGVVDGGEPGDGGAGDGGPVGDAGAGNAATLSGRIRDIVSRAVVPGVRICVHQREADYPCVTTDNSGNYALRAPAGEAITITFTQGQPAIQSSLVHVNLPAGVATWNLLSLGQSSVPLMFNFMAQQNDPTKGHVSFTATANNAGVAGATLSLVPGGGFGPVYLSAQGLPDRAATATSSNGTGTVVNITPGTVELRVTAPNTHDCAVNTLGVLGAGQGWSTPVLAGYLSVAVFDCAAR